jgi:hypothetical protein
MKVGTKISMGQIVWEKTAVPSTAFEAGSRPTPQDTNRLSRWEIEFVYGKNKQRLSLLSYCRQTGSWVFHNECAPPMMHSDAMKNGVNNGGLFECEQPSPLPNGARVDRQSDPAEMTHFCGTNPMTGLGKRIAHSPSFHWLRSRELRRQRGIGETPSRVPCELFRQARVGHDTAPAIGRPCSRPSKLRLGRFVAA